MAYQLNGTNQNLTVAASSAFDFGSSNFTISFNVEHTSVATVQTYLSIYTLNNAISDGLVIRLNNQKAAIVVYINQSSPNLLLGDATTLSANTLYRMCVVRSSDNWTFYINNQTEQSSTASLTLPSNKTLNIGGWTAFTDRYLAGTMSEFAIWNTALAAGEITALAAGFTPDQIRPQSLQFYAPLVRDLIDTRGGRTITNNNAATVATHPRVYT